MIRPGLSVSAITLFPPGVEYIQNMIFMSIALILVTLVAWSTAGEDWGC
jgi:hypothetical protein